MRCTLFCQPNSISERQNRGARMEEKPDASFASSCWIIICICWRSCRCALRITELELLSTEEDGAPPALVKAVLPRILCLTSFSFASGSVNECIDPVLEGLMALPLSVTVSSARSPSHRIVSRIGIGTACCLACWIVGRCWIDFISRSRSFFLPPPAAGLCSTHFE